MLAIARGVLMDLILQKLMDGIPRSSIRRADRHSTAIRRFFIRVCNPGVTLAHHGYSRMGCNRACEHTVRELFGNRSQMVADLLAGCIIGVLDHSDFNAPPVRRQMKMMPDRCVSKACGSGSFDGYSNVNLSNGDLDGVTVSPLGSVFFVVRGDPPIWPCSGSSPVVPANPS